MRKGVRGNLHRERNKVSAAPATSATFEITYVTVNAAIYCQIYRPPAGALASPTAVEMSDICFELDQIISSKLPALETGGLILDQSADVRVRTSLLVNGVFYIHSTFESPASCCHN